MLKTEKEIPKYLFRWNMRAAGQAYDEGLDQTEKSQSQRIFEARLKSHIKYFFNQDLIFDFRPAVDFQTGRKQALDGADRPGNGFTLKHAALEWQALESLQLSGGALNQEEIHSSLVADDIAFPGARLALFTHPGDWTLGAVGESTIPSNSHLQTNTSSVESMPVKNVAQARITWSPKPYIYSKNRIGYFSYQNLPSDVAQASSLIGNTTERLTEEDYTFVYQYAGVEATTSWKFPLARTVDMQIKGAYAQNSEAPSGKNVGYLAGLGFIWRLNSRHGLQVNGEHFRVEPDLAPAYFSNSDNFRTNRLGYTQEVKWHLRKQNFSVGFVHTEAQTIYIDAAQSRAQFYKIYLETDYGT